MSSMYEFEDVLPKLNKNSKTEKNPKPQPSL